jgi:uncharacterized membrane protein
LAKLNALNTLDSIMLQSVLLNNKGAALLVILFLAAGLRLSQLGNKSLWFDEVASIYFAELPTEKLWNLEWSRPESHPPLYYHGLSYWVDWFGDSETSVRLPSALISLINVALIYILGRRLFSDQVGLLAAALLAFSPLHIWYAQEARMYVWMTTIMLLSAILLTWDSWWAFLPLTITFVLGLYIDYTMFPIWSFLSALWFVFWWQRGHPWRPFLIWLVSSTLAWMLFSPWFGNFFAVLESFSTVHIFERLNEVFGVPILTPRQYLILMIIGGITLIPILTILQALLCSEKLGNWVSAIVLCGFVLATVIFPVPRIYGIKRLLVLIWPLIILWVAWIVNQLNFQRQRVVVSLLAISFAMSLIALFGIPKDDWRGAVTYVNENASENDVAGIDPLWNGLPVSYYGLILDIKTGEIESIQELRLGDIWFFAERFPGQKVPATPTEQFLDNNLDLLEVKPFYRLEVRRYGVREQ